MHGGISGCLAPLVQRQPRPQTPPDCLTFLAFCRDKQLAPSLPRHTVSRPATLQLYARRKNLFLKSAFDMCLLQASRNERDSELTARRIERERQGERGRGKESVLLRSPLVMFSYGQKSVARRTCQVFRRLLR